MCITAAFMQYHNNFISLATPQKTEGNYVVHRIQIQSPVASLFNSAPQVHEVDRCVTSGEAFLHVNQLSLSAAVQKGEMYISQKPVVEKSLQL